MWSMLKYWLVGEYKNLKSEKQNFLFNSIKVLAILADTD